MLKIWYNKRSTTLYIVKFRSAASAVLEKNIMSVRTARLHLFSLLLILSAGVICVCFNSCRLRNATVRETEIPISVIETESPDETVKTIPDDGRIFTAEHENKHGKKKPPLREQAADWAAWYDSRWGDGASDEIILASDEIRAMNERIVRDCPAVVDIAALPETMDGASVRALIEAYAIPGGELIDRDGAAFDETRRQAMLDNRALDAIGETVTVRPAVITSRCNMKSFPTELHLYNQPDRRYSQIQETELIVGFPVWILHESADGAFLFVQSYYYAGWIPTEAAALCSAEDFARFAVRENYATVLSPKCVVDDVRLDMGAALPLVDETEDGCRILLPRRADDGTLSLTETLLSADDGTSGSLPFTAANFYNQAYAYLGTPYAWGGADDGVDCSGYVCAICRTFGIYLPRNSGEQEAYNGKRTELTGRSPEDKLAALAEIKGPATLHRKGHVMILLGVRDGVCHIIHAPGGGSVTDTPFTQFDVLTAVDQLG